MPLADNRDKFCRLGQKMEKSISFKSIVSYVDTENTFNFGKEESNSRQILPFTFEAEIS